MYRNGTTNSSSAWRSFLNYTSTSLRGIFAFRMTKRHRLCQSHHGGAADCILESAQIKHHPSRFVRKIGEGTYGDVELWEDSNGKRVAIKKFKLSDNSYRVNCPYPSPLPLNQHLVRADGVFTCEGSFG